MKYLAICLLVLGAGLVGCNKGITSNTGYVCYACEKEVSSSASKCPHCGEEYNATFKPISVEEANSYAD